MIFAQTQLHLHGRVEETAAAWRKLNLDLEQLCDVFDNTLDHEEIKAFAVASPVTRVLRSTEPDAEASMLFAQSAGCRMKHSANLEELEVEFIVENVAPESVIHAPLEAGAHGAEVF